MTFTPPIGWIIKPSPNFSKRKKAISAIVLHADAAANIQSSLNWITSTESEVSYHIMINRNGVEYYCVDLQMKAWHAGISTLDGITNVNEFSIGIGFANKNDGEKFSKVQLAAGIAVCKHLCMLFKIPVDRITTHAIIAPKRKTDPFGLDLLAFREAVR